MRIGIISYYIYIYIHDYQINCAGKLNASFAVTWISDCMKQEDISGRELIKETTKASPL